MRILLIFVTSILCVGTLSAQRLDASRKYSAEPAKTTTAEAMIRDILPRDRVVLDNFNKDRNSVSWIRDVYRIVDIENNQNAAFFFPRESDKQQSNLFSLMFNLVKDNKIQAYKFNLANKLGKDELEVIKFRDMLDLHEIPYTVGAGNSINVSSYDLPTDEIRSFYVREKWVFDDRTGKGDVKIVALCPVLHRPESYEYSESPIIKIPLFWISFEAVSPFLSRAVNYTAVADVNRFAPNLSFFDIIRNRYYEGKIYQIGDRVLNEFYDNEEDMTYEQDRLSAELDRVMNRFNTVR